MPTRPLSPDALAAWAAGPAPSGWPERTVAVVELDGVPADDGRWREPVPAGVPFVVVGLAEAGLEHQLASACDVVLVRDDPALDAVVATVERCPLASFAFAALLRGAPRPLDDGLLLESATYSALQGGPELAAWLATREGTDRLPEGDPVAVERDGAVLRITLQRPHVRNALDAAMREALLDALAVAEADPDLQVELRGAGPDFCAGGDLDEFGTFADPASAHRLRLERSVARVLARLSARTTAHLHGHCAGSGIELPAFAGRVLAAPGTQVRLPELALGLIPGAGGTVSITARIGRHRTALLGLTGAPVDADTALAWGLVDELTGPGDGPA
jgi:hypothetical protein